MGSGGSNSLWSSSNSVGTSSETRFLIGYVMFVFYILSVFRIPAQFAVKQIAWVLYGQASRAISIG